MVYTGKEFAPIIENMNNIDKKSLRDDKEYYEREARYSAHELELAKIRNRDTGKRKFIATEQTFPSRIKSYFILCE